MDTEQARLNEEKRKIQERLAYIQIMLATQPILQRRPGDGLSPYDIYIGGVESEQAKLKNQLQDIDMEILRLEERQKAMAAKSAKLILLERVKRECENRHLPKGVTIDPKTKYDIALAIGMKGLPAPKHFKSGNKAYHRISKYMSELGYKRRKATKFE